MSKIKLTYKDKDYILEFSRNTAKAIEERGFNLNLIDSQPNKMIPLLFHGALMKNHSSLTAKKVEEMYDAQNHKVKLVGAIAELYAETVKSLVGDEEEDEGKNATWEMI